MPLPPLIAALLTPDAYPPGAVKGNIELVQTHISYLFLTRDYVYKIKKPVDFGFLDFTTLQKREHFCNEEVSLNRRLCPHVYLGVVPITENRGRFEMEGRGGAVEYAVKMKRLPHDRMMDVMLDRGDVAVEMLRQVAGEVARFHGRAETGAHIKPFGDIELIRKNTEENFSQTEGYRGRTISKDEYGDIVEYTRGFLDRKGRLFLKRVEEGRIKDCHGDLHSEHICFTDKGIAIFDCIEFNERFRYSDTAADSAFLAMDLDFHHRHDLSKVFCDEYGAVSGDSDFHEILNFYKVYRACVRGKVEGFEIDEPEVSEEEKERALKRARRFFHLAHEYTKGEVTPRLLVVFGLIGTGKSTLANALGKRIGAEVISSDLVRKELAGLPTGDHRYEGEYKGIYTEAFTDRTYGTMMEKAGLHLKEGKNVILDATFSKAGRRGMTGELGREYGSCPYFIECASPEAIIRERLAERRKEPTAVSDGRWEIFAAIKSNFEKMDEAEKSHHIVIDTTGPLDESVKTVIERID